MREIVARLPEHLKASTDDEPVWRAPPFEVSTYRALVEHVAQLAYANRDELLFFRGQDRDFQSRTGGSTLYPPIYRGDSVPAREIRHRFDLLDQASRLLAARFEEEKIDGHNEVRRKRYIQWSILQHYEVTATPLLDITHSLRVACSFAQMKSTEPVCFVYVLGLPYITHRITIDSEHDLVNVRLLSICPPSALRPYFQEAYLAGTADTTTDFDSKTELDFRRRLLAKFAIPRAQSFWGAGFERTPETALFPTNDAILKLCQGLKGELKQELESGELGEFIKYWAAFEDYVLETARQLSSRNVSVRNAINILKEHGLLTATEAQSAQIIRTARNNFVHTPKRVGPEVLSLTLERLRELVRDKDVRV